MTQPKSWAFPFQLYPHPVVRTTSTFNHLSHGVLDRYDLFLPSLAHDFASEAGPEHDGLSAFSKPRDDAKQCLPQGDTSLKLC